ncbi:hypothetical protein [Thiocystis violacea]|uniref:hypothetical protein n=1 Tax=Thiocystis violacea TaxID=13725 RepID=UPI001905FD14|nr:hypothetical protein [Thiocystis violacea]MBK1718265.1 hypothetical protein [Thiocystis violacea]
MHPSSESGKSPLAGLWLVLGLVTLGLIATVVYKTWPLLYPPLTELAALNSRCDLRASPCEAVFGGGRWVRFAIEPRDLPTSAPLRLGVETAGLDVAAVEVDFAGVDMYMGFNRVSLAAVQKGRYAGQGMLPVCVRERMTWEARVLIHTPDGLLAAPFRFDTNR